MKYRITKNYDSPLHFVECWTWNPFRVGIALIGMWLLVYRKEEDERVLAAGFRSKEEAMSYIDKLISGEIELNLRSPEKKKVIMEITEYPGKVK